METPWRELYQRLAANPDFLLVWGEGPIRERIEALEKKLRDPQVTEPVEVAAIKAELNAYAWLRQTVERPPEPVPAQEPKRRWRRVIGTFSSPLLPRPLG
jgi:hypothetical protein